MTFTSCNRFSDARKYLLGFKVLLVREKTIDLCAEILSSDVFVCFAGLLRENLLYIRSET